MKNFLASTALFSTMMLVAAPAWALAGATAADQSATDPTTDSVGIGDIVVTAQKRSENIQDVPVAISAVGEKYLESRGVDSIDKLGTIAPNVKIERMPSNKTASQIAIRGSVTINPAITWEPAVGLYLDGVYIAKAQGSIFDIADLERVELLRGPQGTLYGRNALAGAVNLITKKPSGQFGGLLEATYGSFNEMKVRGVVDLPRVGIFSAKVSGQYRRRDGIIDLVQDPYNSPGAGSPVRGSTDSVDSGSFMVQLRAELSSNITADYTYDYSKTSQTPQYSQLLRVNRNGDPSDIFDPNSPGYAYGGAYFPLDRYTNPDRSSTGSIDGDVYERSRSYGHALTLTANLGFAELKSITAYRDLAWGDAIDLDGTPLAVAYIRRDTDYHAFSQELQMTGEAFNDRLKYVVGGFYFTEKAETDNPQTYFGGATDIDSFYGSHTKAFALYAQADYSLTDSLKLTLGGRYTHERKDIKRFFRLNYDASSGITSPYVIGDIGYGDVPDATFEAFSPAATLSYEVAPDINVYARYAQGFKSGGFNGETNVFGVPTVDCPTGALELCEPYRPEKVDSYELGFKSKLLGNRLILNVAAFRDEHKDMQVSIFTASTGAASVIKNAGAARIQGLEFEVVARPFDSLTLNGSLALLDPTYKKFIDGGVDVAGNRAFPHAPKTTAAINADWLVAEGDWGKFNVYGDLSYVSKYFTYPYALDVANASDQTAYNTRSPGRTIVNLRATVSEVMLGDVAASLSVFVRNLTKEDAPSNFIDFGRSFGGLTVGYFPDPRTFGVTAGVKF